MNPSLPLCLPFATLCLASCFLGLAANQAAGADPHFELTAAPSPVDNPLKGLVPYAAPEPGRFPHSMEFSYLPLSDLMVGKDQFDWQPMESLLDKIASRGNQAVVRIYMEYPGHDEGIPEFLETQGMKVHQYTNTNTAPFPPKTVRTPDYEDAGLRTALQDFIRAFGANYDGDPRLAYVTAGLLGTWGEWHTYPRNELWASKQTQQLVLDAYAAAFTDTPILLRYPAGPDHGYQAENASRPFGYHDDSFSWATIETGRREDDWFYMPALKSAGSAAIDKWKTQPIGGEIRPEVWGKIFDKRTEWPPQAQSFHDCVSATHASWLMDTGMFREAASPQRFQRAETEVRRMGYDLHLRSATFSIDPSQSTCQLKLELINQGVAPFYANWPTEIAWVDSHGSIAARQIAPGLAMRGHLPDNAPHELKASLTTTGLSGDYTVLLRVVHPLTNGKPLRFANAEQDQTQPGWITLGKIGF
ncbi:DUF4832 domain-containing protein [Stieleria sp. TO1_6]|uniref:DUF4832 domain-containing protein n=1 Tax=Stieleria tagensis TaxID=2956795 RepID=UPI00209A7999|nr:DUF4832 domain-containing protein [Stieleria tagensis]MCO8124073.1 DUF4832 domain-containing protein [Stieleria tagensis]